MSIAQIHLLRHPRVQVRSMRCKLPDQLDTVHVSGPLGRRIVIADARLADRRNRVQDRVPRQVGVRIRAGVQQIGRQFLMSVRYRHEQRAGAGPGPPLVATSPLRRLCGLVYLRPPLQQDPYNAGPAFS